MSQAELFASDMPAARMDELIIEAAKKAGYCVIMAGTEMRGHYGRYVQESSIIKIGMSDFKPHELHSLFANFLTLAMTELTMRDTAQSSSLFANDN